MSLASLLQRDAGYEALRYAVWPDEATDPDPYPIVPLVARLRTRLDLARDHLQTEKRAGYRLADPGRTDSARPWNVTCD